MAREAKLVIAAQDKTKEGVSSAVRNLLGIDDAAKKVGDTLKTAFTVTAIVAAGKKLAEFGAECVTAFGEVERSNTQLKTALGGSESSFRRMNDLIGDLSKKSLASSTDLRQMVATLASFGRSDADIERISEAAVALSNATGKTLNEAVLQVNKSFGGLAGELGEVFPEIKALTKEQLQAGAAADVLREKFGAVSDSMSGGIAQQLKNTRDSMDELKQAIGANIAPAFAPMLGYINTVIEGWNSAAQAHLRYKRALIDDPVLAGMLKKQEEIENELRAYQRRADKGRDAGGLLAGAYDPQEGVNLKKRLDAQLRIIQEYQLKASGKTGLEMSAPVPLVTAPSVGGGSSSSGASPLSTIAAGATDLVAPTDKLLANIVALGGVLPKLEEPATGFAAAWGQALDNIQNRVGQWSDFISSSIFTMVDGIGSGFEAIGAALVNGTSAWDGFAGAALQALSQVLSALGSQLAAMAVVELVKLNFAGAALAAAGSAAAFIAAGAIGAAASNMNGAGAGSSSSPPSGSDSGGSSSVAATYTGPRNITFNFYNQGNVVGSGGLTELALLIRDILKREERYA